MSWLGRAVSRLPHVATLPAGERRNAAVLSVLSAVNLLRSRNTSDDPVHLVFHRFVDHWASVAGEVQLLEIGSRLGPRSGRVRDLFPGVSIVGFDVHPGPSVDVVGDAHSLAAHFPPATFDGAYSISVFEHLAMPWKVVVDLNTVLKQGALVFVSTHPTWPMHEHPWDFWRFSTEAMRVLFNPATGFQVLTVVDGLPCSILPVGRERSMKGLPFQPANLSVSLLARKVAEPDPDLAWNIPIRELLDTHYPL
jgi:hypothetical protein